MRVLLMKSGLAERLTTISMRWCLLHGHMGRDWVSSDDGSIDFVALIRPRIVWPVQRTSTSLSVVPEKRKASIRTQEQLDVAPGNAVPSDLENHSYSMSEALAGLAVFLVAIVLVLGRFPGNLDVDYSPCQAECMPVDLVLAMTMPDNIAD